ncbi:hypothetical protein LXL04_029649 [Taraxacum kok-saghyz]
MSRYSFSKDVQVPICGIPYNLDRDLLAARSSKLCKLFKENPDEDLSHLVCNIPTTPQVFELMARFCYGLEVKFTPENVIPISCLACYLGMTDNHSPNNLLTRALSFFKREIITGWNESIRSLKSTEDNQLLLQQAMKLGLIDACLDSIITKALNNPTHLPVYKQRQLFVVDSEQDQSFLSLTTLGLQFYEPIIHGMIQGKMGSINIASNLYEYAKKWVFSDPKDSDQSSSSSSSSQGVYSNSRRDTIEAIEKLFPNDRAVVPCEILSEMLRYAIILEANSGCRQGFELRIGKQLDLATVDDLLIPSQGYSQEEKYDTECVRRILEHFYNNFTGGEDNLEIVADLVEDFLAEVAKDVDLKKESFISLAEMSNAASQGTQRSSDGIYRAIDIYLNQHGYLIESEREEICAVLDCNKMSPEACEHAARNERLPVRVAVQVLFAGQLQLRETITKEAEEEAVVAGKLKEVVVVEEELEKMNFKVMELEKECGVMRKEIERGYFGKMKVEKGVGKVNVNVWRVMKRKLGCISSLNNCNCRVKKKKIHPR